VLAAIARRYAATCQPDSHIQINQSINKVFLNQFFNKPNPAGFGGLGFYRFYCGLVDKHWWMALDAVSKILNRKTLNALQNRIILLIFKT